MNLDQRALTPLEGAAKAHPTPERHTNFKRPVLAVATPSDHPTKPVLLDGFCKAGGMTKGFQRAGFYVVGVDIEDQPNYCGDAFVKMDFLDFMRRLLDGEKVAGWRLGDFAAFHGSPPCQGYSVLKGLTEKFYPRLIEETRRLFRKTGQPYVIENVAGARPYMDSPVMLCGSGFGLRVWRHRLFESNFSILGVPCSHHEFPEPIDVTGTGGFPRKPRTAPGGGLSRKPKNLAEAREAMGIDWMTRPELAEAIPPAYAEWIGGYLLVHLQQKVAA